MLASLRAVWFLAHDVPSLQAVVMVDRAWFLFDVAPKVRGADDDEGSEDEDADAALVDSADGAESGKATEV